MHKVYVYGTLRPGSDETVEVPGTLYNLGWFPGIDLTDTSGGPVTCEVLEVDDERLASLDRYEGYYEDDLEGSLYLRVPYNGGWIYTYNRSFDSFKVIEGGDWLASTGQEKGVAA